MENRCSLGPLRCVFSGLNLCILAADAHARQVIMDRKLNSNPAEIFLFILKGHINQTQFNMNDTHDS